MKRVLFSLFFPLYCTNLLYGSEDIFFRKQAQEGIQAIYDLDYSKAQNIFDQLKRDEPDSPVGYGMTAMRAWNELLFSSRNLAIYRYGIPTPFDSVKPRQSESPQKKAFLNANKALQDKCDELLKKDPNNLLALYFKGVSYENLSTQALTLEGRMLDAKSFAQKANEIHEKVLELDKNFIDAKTSNAVLEYVVGTFNIALRWILRIGGLHGDKKGAVEKLQEVSDKGIYRGTDASVVFALLEEWKGDPKRAISLLGKVRSMHPRSYMCDIGLAAVYEGTGKDPKAAIRIYQELLRDMPKKAPGIHTGEIFFRIGKDYANLHDYSLAIEQFEKALKEEQGDPETKPLSYYSLARVYEERGDNKMAENYYRSMLEYSGPTALIEEEIEKARKKAK
jgi:tetratricopeptide (TPR) repeat protein